MNFPMLFLLIRHQQEENNRIVKKIRMILIEILLQKVHVEMFSVFLFASTMDHTLWKKSGKKEFLIENLTLTLYGMRKYSSD